MRIAATFAVSTLACAAACGHGAAGRRSAERVTTLEAGAAALRVSDGGAEGPPVVFVHGLGDDGETWRAQLEHLRAAGRRAVAYDQRGHGASGRARNGVYTIEELAGDLDAVVRALSCGKVVLVAHSFSGTVITAWAGAHPDSVAGLLYVDAVGDLSAVPPQAAAAWVDSEVPSDAAALRVLYERMLGAKARPATREHLLAAISRLDLPAFVALRRSMIGFDAKAPFARVRAPALALESEEAAENPVMAGKILGVPVTRFSGASHWVQLDDPAAVNGVLDALLARIPR